MSHDPYLIYEAETLIQKKTLNPLTIFSDGCSYCEFQRNVVPGSVKVESNLFSSSKTSSKTFLPVTNF